MSKRLVIKVSGESGRGIVSSGSIIMKSLKRVGYFITADREYPSLIQGGCANYQINISNKQIFGFSKNIDIAIGLDSIGLKDAIESVREGGIIIHGYERWERGFKGLEEVAKSRNLKVVYIPALSVAKEQGGGYRFVNTVLLGLLWKVLGLDFETVKDQVKDTFGSRPQWLDINFACLKAGFDFIDKPLLKIPFQPSNQVADTMLIDGNTALSIGAIHAGMSCFYAYPMSPASSILTYIAKTAKDTNILVKQAEDEITAMQMVIGSMHMGARSMTATSGGGFDLMTETISLAGITETPAVVVIAQRPGPGTGLPTWTGQGDLDLAIYSGHGEYGKIVVSCSNPTSCFENIQHSFNLAEKFQVPVIVLTEKMIAENTQTVPAFDQNIIPIERGLVEGDNLKVLNQSDRFKKTDSGISKRWLPGSSETIYFANGDEHKEDGTLDESVDADQMIAKRVRKLDTIRESLLDPIVYGAKKGADISFVGWGGTRNVMIDVIFQMKSSGVSVNYIHFDFVYPLKTNILKDFFKENKKVCLIEGNVTGQLGGLIQKNTDLKFAAELLKYNGRPFLIEDVVDFIRSSLK